MKANKIRVNALLIVDVQNDFITGTLSLSNCPSKHLGEEVVPIINHLLETIKFDVIVYTQDWHPNTHISFYECLNLRQHLISADSKVNETNAKLFDHIQFSPDDENPKQESVDQVLWPTHCVQNTTGADLHKELQVIGKKTSIFHINKQTPIIRLYKGTNPEVDSYSAFWDNQKISQTTLDGDLKKFNVTDVFIVGIATDVCVYATALHATENGYHTYVVEDACRGVDENAITSKLQDLKEHNCQIIKSNEVKTIMKTTEVVQ
ncbi:unnamed protein product [Didymodactylos carnosus]|uniref:nicotinamidase n=1 Tax=Didymodactylos carnosus TaxID=1234261 RepID=A0A814SVJ3_9BILA|nr:unnamed protein product [Didymodactylos carnosus]CAF1255293.1 unnamed protein product [Didymodactylos carnosus]CAF3914533.1 unnamed protein product [Didymodactylos carnosus]CAF4062390.1 unnamed protein product [Didymodactylos carnosus]